MSGVNWTDKQLEAIEYGGENILVAAAAGSGKTAVLVERIIRKITNKEKPVGIDEVLVLTFTEAAASEMKNKIARAVRAELAQNPHDRHIQRQNLLMNSAMISTIHAFCMSVLRKNIHHTQLPVSFGIISEEENNMLLRQAMDAVLEKFYANIDRDSSFGALAVGYGGIKNDSALRELLNKLYKFLDSMPDPVRWVNNSVRRFKNADGAESLSDNAFAGFLFDEVVQSVNDILQIYEIIFSEIDSYIPAEQNLNEFFEAESGQFKAVAEAAKNRDYQGICDALDKIGFARLVMSKGKDASLDELEAKDRIRILRPFAKKLSENLRKKFIISEGDALLRMGLTYPTLRTFKNITLMIRRIHTKLKREKNYLDFSDLEHETLKLLRNPDGSPSAVAVELSEKYNEILVDEYQDTNHIQDTIFRLISRQNSNIFMVGDIKQCIYKFRHAVPELFLKKYKDYSVPNGGGHLICLSQNFRSREGVVNSVNHIFSRIMSSRTGDVDYTPEECLVHGANYPPEAEGRGFETELLLTDIGTEDGTISSADGMAYEAANIAKRISEIVEGAEVTVTDKQSGELRAAEYRDIVILARVKSICAVMEAALIRAGVPAYSVSGQEYLSSPEVLGALSFLQIIDNPRQDIPLIAVLRSPVFGFTAGELADIRACEKKVVFYDAMLAAAETNQKVSDFLEVLNEFRKSAPHIAVSELIWKFYYDTGYLRTVSAMDNPVLRRANLRLLYERAAEFENSSLQGGILRFLEYIDAVRGGNGDFSAARVLGENDNVVKIITMHKSKGLEFPIVFIPGISKKFNDGDLKSPILWDSNLGFGLRYVDTEKRIKYPSLPMDVLKLKIDNELHSEEMRLLYVALTRAKEKLIISASVFGRSNSWTKALYAPGGKVLGSFVHTQNNMRDWVLPALAAHPDAGILREHIQAAIEGDAEFPLNIRCVAWSELDDVFDRAINEETADKSDAAEEVSADMVARLEYKYPYREYGDIPVKLSVSEIKQRQMPEGEYVPLLNALVDKNLKSADEITGSDKGTITHFVMQHISDEETDSIEQIRQQIEQMCENGMITTKQRSAVNEGQIFAFYQSNIGKRMKSSRRQKEYKFYLELPAEEIFPDAAKDAGHTVLLQGVVDCFFEEEGGLVIVDYKTDNVSENYAESAAQRYSEQLKYYAAGLSRIFDKPVKGKYIYFLNCSKEVEL